MIASYRELFSSPGTLGFTLAGMLARLSLPMTGIGIIMLLSQLNGSFALAGSVSATFVVTYALLSPQISRLVDRYGQRRVLPVAAALSVSGMLTISLGTLWPAPQWVLFAGALLTGFMPGMSAMIRARWTSIYRGHPRLRTAYSLESVLDEITFIAGPPLAIALCVMLIPQGALLSAALMQAGGVAALVCQRRTEPPVDVNGADGSAVSPLRSPGVPLLMLLMAAMGVIVGTIDIATVAFAGQLGQPAAASVVLSAYAVGSCFSGLLFGAVRLTISLPAMLLLGALGIAATALPLMVVSSIPGLTLAVLIAGLFFAPTMIVAMSLVEQLVPANRLTEGMSWLLAGLNVGVAIGAAISGQRLDDGSAHDGFSVALYAAALIVGIALWGYRRLQVKTAAPSPG